ncbi:hypothetical protein GOV05_00150 [Candidatus Woesearchaeota archaeon]|nr:hypothetical protein [Candidatus Woesearchaeota archaeon]
MDVVKTRKVLSWTMLGIVILYILTGYGITKYRIVEAMTFGLLTKARSFIIHEKLIIPLALLLVAHLYLTTFHKKKK